MKCLIDHVKRQFIENSLTTVVYLSRHTSSIQRLQDVYTTSLTSNRCLIDVETTSCVYWDSLRYFHAFNTDVYRYNHLHISAFHRANQVLETLVFDLRNLPLLEMFKKRPLQQISTSNLLKVSR